MKNKKLQFPNGFLWGAGVSSHQVEGGNVNDWSEWEKNGKQAKEESGIACDYWNRFETDHKLAKDLGLNAFRISLEWSRIEPEEGKFSEEAIEHYRKMLQDIKSKGMRRVVTLNHYTLPIWFSKKYGWHKKESASLFARYCGKVTGKLGMEMDIVVTINEPRLVINKGYLTGEYPPGKHNPFFYFQARKNLVEAHKEAYKIIKSVYRDLPVGITQFTNDFDYFGRGRWQNWLTEKMENFYNWHFFDEIGADQDFIGINYYYGAKIRLKYPFYELATYEKKVTDMGWGIMPEGIYEIIMDAWKKYHKPIYILENGIADREDKYRAAFIKGHLRAIHKAIGKGADARGYFYWSLLDNFEWNAGYDMQFGLYSVDRKTLERKLRKSAGEYAKICENNEIVD
ncbi:MAG TPA: glycoside hydrolase family 1 protein [Patescibacteria group bacterium]|nr:glycoside hydrolase family 1 protein [Patescibacteria group bacterium]